MSYSYTAMESPLDNQLKVLVAQEKVNNKIVQKHIAKIIGISQAAVSARLASGLNMKLKSLIEILNAIGRKIIIVPVGNYEICDSGRKQQSMKKRKKSEQRSDGQYEWDVRIKKICEIADEALTLLTRSGTKAGLDIKDAFMSQQDKQDFKQFLLSLSLAVELNDVFKDTIELRRSVFTDTVRAALLTSMAHPMHRLGGEACMEEQNRLIGDKKLYTFLELFVMLAYNKLKTKERENI